MSARRRERELRGLVASTGLTLVALTWRRHVVLDVRDARGREVRVFVSGTPSDVGSLANERARLRRVARGGEP